MAKLNAEKLVVRVLRAAISEAAFLFAIANPKFRERKMRRSRFRSRRALANINQAVFVAIHQRAQ